MKLSDITTSLTLAKELKEVGYQQESLFYWQNEIGFTKVNVVKDKFILVSKAEAEVGLSGEYGKNYKVYSAPTAEELLEWLPHYIKKIEGYLSIQKQIDFYWVFYEDKDGFIISEYEIEGKTATEALAKMLIYLAKNKIIKFER